MKKIVRASKKENRVYVDCAGFTAAHLHGFTMAYQSASFTLSDFPHEGAPPVLVVENLSIKTLIMLQRQIGSFLRMKRRSDRRWNATAPEAMRAESPTPKAKKPAKRKPALRVVG